MFVLYSDVGDERTLCFVFDCYVSDKNTLYLEFFSDVSDERTFCFAFDCSVSDTRTLNLYFIVTLLLSARCVLYLIVTLVISAHYICTSLPR